MKTRTIDALASMGYTGDIASFRTILIETKAEMFPGLSVDELILTRDQAQEYVNAVKVKVGCPKMTRVAILRALVNVRKAGRQQKA